ncbi:MAG: hypothetical protein ACOYOV_12495 [Bacteroidales bacterium]
METNLTVPKTILLTGLPRSGTTLVCHLLTSLPNVVALNEPMKVQELSILSTDKQFAAIDQFISENRDSLITNCLATSKHIEGKIPDNTFSNNASDKGLRVSLVEHGQLSFHKKLSEDFILAIKHNAAFAYLLNKLVFRYSCYGIIRNPLAILFSWQTVDLNIHYGHIPVGEAFDLELRETLARIDDTLDRQIYILNWFFTKFDQNLPAERIIQYENVIASNGRTLKVITPEADFIQVSLKSRNKNPIYKQGQFQKIADKLLESKGIYWKYYSIEDVLSLLNNYS